MNSAEKSSLFSLNVYGNPFIGIYARLTDRFAIVGTTIPEKFIRGVEAIQAKAIKTTISDSDLTGLYCVANSNGIGLTPLASKEERAKLADLTGMNVEILKTEFTAVGNNIVVNDNGALMNPRLYEHDLVRQIRDLLGVEAVSLAVAGYNTVGAMVLATNKGFIAHPNASEKEISEIGSVLNVKGGIGTANGGVPFVPICVIANKKGVIFGEETTGFETHRINECLDLI